MALATVYAELLVPLLTTIAVLVAGEILVKPGPVGPGGPVGPPAP